MSILVSVAFSLLVILWVFASRRGLRVRRSAALCLLLGGASSALLIALSCALRPLLGQAAQVLGNLRGGIPLGAV
jgi:uncharacterized membrane protein YdcZ (DUF606 family)